MRHVGSVALALAVALYAGGRLVRRYGFGEALFGTSLAPAALLVVSLVAVVLAAYGSYRLVVGFLVSHTASKRRRHDVRNVLRLAFGALGLIACFGVVTRAWVSVLLSFGVVGFAITFALQGALASLIGWFYIVVKRPYAVGDRIAIEDTRGDVASIDLFVTEVWEIDGELVSTNQPSGRIVTVPNSVVLTSHVVNFYGEGVPYVWNELSVQVAYETDIEFATGVMVEVAEDYLGDEMAAGIDAYRERLEETPVELDVNEGPTVNVVQQESWVELRLRYLVHPRRGTRTRNALYRAILDRFNDSPDRVAFPVSRSR
ncbi:Small-conductance mechanosensitive channel [Haloplanus vescus]|uniref:Small-conductance mechanosensitive channel n=1 Tax=Haloplanus vescus TaxID=555874 RepID=A0A1H3VNH2_9EURY|nr:mechanosensitive ion channel family protein [Haloplanus vescus]SDZ76335.1 Small-conductance mechanosensitive channel [Haloplanus vescus]